jgi:hypothetical protein
MRADAALSKASRQRAKRSKSTAAKALINVREIRRGIESVLPLLGSDPLINAFLLRSGATNFVHPER